MEQHDDAVLFIDEIHTVIGAGATSGGAMDASTCSSSTSRWQTALHGVNNLQRVPPTFCGDNPEPALPEDRRQRSVEDAVKILRGLKP